MTRGPYSTRRAASVCNVRFHINSYVLDVIRQGRAVLRASLEPPVITWTVIIVPNITGYLFSPHPIIAQGGSGEVLLAS